MVFTAEEVQKRMYPIHGKGLSLTLPSFHFMEQSTSRVNTSPQINKDITPTVVTIQTATGQSVLN